MAYEILNNAQVTPLRLHALLRLVPRLDAPRRDDLLKLLQPPELEANTDLGADVFRAAANCELTREDPDSKVVSLTMPAGAVETVDGFRIQMQQALLGRTETFQPNYLLSLFTAWYAAQDDAVLRMDAKEFETRFSAHLFPDAQPEDRPFNTTKFNGWRQWAAFLGWGWFLDAKAFKGDVLVPDAYRRIETVLGAALPADGRAVEFGGFALEVARWCPELDGGELYRRCWEASRGADVRGNRLSLMLSNALRGLHDAGRVAVTREADAAAVWQLFPAVGHRLNQVTHIRLGRV
jgi:hypothetical protein